MAEQMTFDRIISSPLTRARETAEIISSALNVPVEFDPVWLERSAGNFPG
jgi:broad specificity phosphatase PhoE